MRRTIVVVLSAAVVALGMSHVSAQQTTPPARPTAAPPPTYEPAPAAPVMAPVAGYQPAPAMAPAPGQDVTPPPPPQRGGRGGAQGIPGGVAGRGGRGGQQPSAPTPAAAGRNAFYAPGGMMENIKVDVVLSDSVTPTGGKKTVSMVVTNGRKGQIRSQNGSSYTLNVDAQPQMLQDGRILVALDLMYLPETTSEAKQVALINESLSVALTAGSPMLVSQSADPRSDRKVTVEVTASVVK